MADQRAYARTFSQTLTLVAGLFCLEKRVSYRRLRKHPPVSAERGPAEIRSVREKGYAIIDEELEVGLRSPAVPVARSTGEIIAAVSVSAFSARVRATSSVA